MSAYSPFCVYCIPVSSLPILPLCSFTITWQLWYFPIHHILNSFFCFLNSNPPNLLIRHNLTTLLFHRSSFTISCHPSNLHICYFPISCILYPVCWPVQSPHFFSLSSVNWLPCCFTIHHILYSFLFHPSQIKTAFHPASPYPAFSASFQFDHPPITTSCLSFLPPNPSPSSYFSCAQPIYFVTLSKVIKKY